MVYTKLIRPILFRMEPGRVHDQALLAGKVWGSTPVTRQALAALYDWQHPMLKQEVGGVTFRNPVGLAAGFDKECQLMSILPALGFGYEEVGSITAEAYGGNNGPWLVRLPKDQSIIVNYGLKNKGAEHTKKRFFRHGKKRHFSIPIGISVAMTNKQFNSLEERIADWVACLRIMKDCGDYITLNVSCPNTYEPADFTNPKNLTRLLSVIEKTGLEFHKPVFLKLGADLPLEQFDEIVRVCDQYDFITGFVLTNSVKDRSKLHLVSHEHEYAGHKGGISGKPVFPYALTLVRHAYEKAGDRYAIIGCGGIFTPEDAYQFIRNGATLVQLITGMIYGGPATIKRINKGLVQLLARDGYSSISQAIGADANPIWRAPSTKE